MQTDKINLSFDQLGFIMVGDGLLIFYKLTVYLSGISKEP